MTPDAFRRQIASGRLDPVYVLLGDDEAGKSSLIAALVDSVEAELRAFNVDRLYGADASTTMARVMEAARTLPWMASRRLVVVMQAEKLLAARQGREADAEGLEQYLEDPVPTTVLVLAVSGELDKRLGLTRTLQRRATTVDCGGVAGARDVTAWVGARAGAAGVAVDQGAVAALVELTGGEVGRVRSAVEKLLMFAADSRRITADAVRALVSAGAERDPWAVNRALERDALDQALRELSALLDEGVAPYMVLGQLRSFVERSVPPSRLEAATNALMRSDLALKTSGGDPRVVLERLVVELAGDLHEGSSRSARTTLR